MKQPEWTKTSPTAETWRERFNKEFSVGSFTWNGDNATGLISARSTQRKVRNFIASEIAKAEERGYERGSDEMGDAAEAAGLTYR